MQLVRLHGQPQKKNPYVNVLSSPVEANGDFELLVFFPSKLNVGIAINVPFVHTDVVVIRIVLMN